jgi:hypothetical protein
MSDFYSDFCKIVNTQQSRSVILCGNIHDLFPSENHYVPLVDCLCKKASSPQFLQIVVELNGPLRIENEQMLREAYIAWKGGCDTVEDMERLRKITQKVGNTSKNKYQILAEEFDGLVNESQENSTLALQFLRQLTMCSRAKLRSVDGKKVNLLIVIEGADLLLPAKDDISSLSDKDRKRIGIIEDWFSDPAFCSGGDAVCLIAESRSLIHPRVARLPQVLAVEVPSPNTEERKKYIEWFCNQNATPWKIPYPGGGEWKFDNLADLTAGLSIHGVRQILCGARYSNEPITIQALVDKIEDHIQSQLGEDVVEFKKPQHTLKDIVGFSDLKRFLQKEGIPRFRNGTLSGCAVAGSIGSGKTFTFEAVAAELGLPVIVLKNVRSQWYGQTDVIFEKLRAVLEALGRVCIFMDECDTSFGGVGKDTHETERRLTGKIQQMMSDPSLKGKVIWLLMTARIHMLSPDIRRPGRAGDLILPVLDPVGQDREDFIRWSLGPIADKIGNKFDVLVKTLDTKLDSSYSAAAFSTLRDHLKINYHPDNDDLISQITFLVEDLLPPNIGKTREYQTLQALVNCTRKCLLPSCKDIKQMRDEWDKRIRELESEGIC